MKAINIIWDTDNKELPESITIPRSLFYSDIEVISDYITEQTGFCHKGFNLLRTESDCLKLIEDAIKLKLLISEGDKIYVYKEGIMDMVLVGKDEAAYDLYNNQEAQEFFVSKINEVDNKKTFTS